MEFVHEFVGHYVALEGSLWRTLGALLFKPGHLTLAYLRGQRQRYVLPLRLFLSASFVFFFLIKVLGSPESLIEVRSNVEPAAELARCRAAPTQCSAADVALLERLQQTGGMQGLKDKLSGRLVNAAPYLVFALVPVFAGIVKLVYRQRRRNYGEHFVFALHTHAFGFLAMLIGAWLPWSGASFVVVALVVVHTVLALHRAYADRWPATLARATLIALLYLAALAAVSAGLGMWAVKTL